jgi:hypothetical protein
MRLKILRNGSLVNVIEADPAWATENFPGCQIVEEPLPPPSAAKAPPSRRVMSKLQFRRRFTMDELIKFDSPELFLPNLTDAQRATIRTMQRNFDAAGFIDLDDPLLVQGLSLMVQYGLLTQERVNQILGG